MSLVAALAACEFPSKVGDLEGSGSGEPSGSSASTSSEGESGATGSGGVEGSTSTTTTQGESGATGSGGIEGSTSTTTTQGESGATGSGGLEDSASTTSESGGADCLGLAEGVCEATAGCKAIRGNEHVLKNGGACVDDQVFVFLGCDFDTGACPPFIPTVCPKGQVKPQFDVPAGCVPPGFENCEPDSTQPCP